MMVNLQLIGSSLLEMHKIADNGKLFAKRCHHDNILTRAYSKINQEYFYGRFAGFHVSQTTFKIYFYSFFIEILPVSILTDGRASQKLHQMFDILNG